MGSQNFDLHRLGWKSFEDLSISILKEVLGQTFQKFSEGVDGGRDGAFYGKWKTENAETLEGNFVMQCKHTSTPNKALSFSVLKNEFKKAQELHKKGLLDIYILLTNYKYSAQQDVEITQKFLEVGIKKCLIFGTEWISQTIQEKPRLRRLVPRLYGLGDLTQIINHQAYEQAREILNSLDEDLAKFVPTKAYRQCADALTNSGFAILLGEPASGKSTIAYLMALSAADEWGLQTVMITDPEQIQKQWNPSDPKQLFWVDDAFGQTQYDASRAQTWNKIFPFLLCAIKQGARAVFTSRDYIFSRAERDLKRSAFPLLDDSRVKIKVEELSVEEKRQIIYNHLKMGNQSKEFRKSIKPFLSKAASTKIFLPEVARRLGTNRFTKTLKYTEKSILNFFENPKHVLEEVIETLATSEKAALSIIYTNGGELSSPFEETEKNCSTIAMLQSTVADVKNALPHLDGTLIKKTYKNNEILWKFRHPTVKDSFASIVASNSELIDIYLNGVSPDKLLGEVTCGDVKYEGAKIIIPSNRFHFVNNILKQLSKKEKNSDKVNYFLAYRCSKDYLKQYFDSEASILKLINGIMFISFGDDNLQLLKVLSEEGLLSSEIKELIFERIEKVTLIDCSPGFNSPFLVGNLLSSENKKQIIEKLKNKISSDLSNILYEIKDNCDSEPEECFSDIEETLEIIREFYHSDVEICHKIKEGLEYIEELIGELNTELDKAVEYSDLDASHSEVLEERERDIFDDVDE